MNSATNSIPLLIVSGKDFQEGSSSFLLGELNDSALSQTLEMIENQPVVGASQPGFLLSQTSANSNSHVYTISKGEKAFRFIPLPDQGSSDRNLKTLIRAFSTLSIHGTKDHPIFHHPDPISARQQIYDRIFQSDIPLGLYCYQSAFLLVDLLKNLGYQALLLHLHYKKPFSSISIYNFWTDHWVVEAWLPQQKRWLLTDPDMGVVEFRDGKTNLPQTFLDLQKKPPNRLIFMETTKDRWLVSRFTGILLPLILHDGASGIGCPLALARGSISLVHFETTLADHLETVTWYAENGWANLRKVNEEGLSDKSIPHFRYSVGK